MSGCAGKSARCSGRWMNIARFSECLISAIWSVTALIQSFMLSSFSYYEDGGSSKSVDFLTQRVENAILGTNFPLVILILEDTWFSQL
jgi:hypothetical protein